MCGIAGIVGEAGKKYARHMQRMLDALKRRGPDGEGVHIFENCILGHRRLSIIDIEGGQQPMTGPNGNSAITYNGELYNFQELKKGLDHPFTTHSDTEVMLAWLLRHGHSNRHKLNGMFAFGLWDDKTQSLLLGRDRFGQKPLYYAMGNNNEFIFASEIKAILASGIVRAEIDPHAISHFLQRLYVYGSLYKNIHVLPPGHFLQYRHGKITLLPPDRPDIVIDQHISEQDAADELRQKLKDAVKNQLIADVEPGVLLSGGLDSSTVTAFASQERGALKSFSFTFGNGVNEAPFAEKVSRTFGTSHFSFSDSDEDIASHLLHMATVYDEPFADSSNIATWLLAGHVRQEVKFALGGDGGDELLAGYTNYQRLYQAKSANSAKQKLTNDLLDLKYRFKGIKMPKAGSHQWIYQGYEVYFSNKVLASLGLPEVLPYQYSWTRTGKDAMEDILRQDVEIYLPYDILTKTDRAGMAHGLELRSPFLDNDVADLCLSLPAGTKLSGSKGKLILRKAMEDILPPEILQRGKQGFGAPVKEWLQQPAMQQLKNDLLMDPDHCIYRLLDHKTAKPVAEQNNYLSWALLVLAIWFDHNTSYIQLP